MRGANDHSLAGRVRKRDDQEVTTKARAGFERAPDHACDFEATPALYEHLREVGDKRATWEVRRKGERCDEGEVGCNGVSRRWGALRQMFMLAATANGPKQLPLAASSPWPARECTPFRDM